MRIGIFTDTYLPDINGVATASHILKKELMKHGHEVLVVTTEVRAGENYEEDGQIIRLSGIELKWLYNYRLANFYSAKAMKMIRQANLDLIHVQTEFSVGIFGKIAAQILNIPVVYTYHTQYEDYVHYLPGLGKIEATEPLLKKVVSNISRIYGDNCTELIAPSTKTKEILESYGIENEIHVIGTGLELDRFEKKNADQVQLARVYEECGIQEGQFVLTFLGRVASEKSIDIIIQAMPYFKEKNLPVRLLIVGGGPALDELKEQASSLLVDEMIYFAGPKKADLVPYYYFVSDAFVSASITETQGLTFIEAMASGLPVLARFDKNLEGVIKDGENGYFFKDEKDLADIVERLMHEDFSQLQQQAYMDSRQYTSETFYEKMIQVYEQAIIHKHYSYKVSSITERHDHMYNVVLKADDIDLSLHLPEPIIQRYELEKGKVVDRACLEELKDYEFVSKGYKKALKYLTSRDYTRAQMSEKLSRSEELDEVHVDMIIHLLEQKHLIDDYAYAKDYLAKASRMGMGIRKALQKLREKGIPQDILESLRENYARDIEVENAAETIRKLSNQNRTRSHGALIHNIRNRLFSNGFEQDVIEEAMHQVTIETDEDLEKQLLHKEMEKAYQKYAKRYSDQALDTHVYSYLARKGFQNDWIKTAMMERRHQFDEED